MGVAEGGQKRVEVERRRAGEGVAEERLRGHTVVGFERAWDENGVVVGREGWWMEEVEGGEGADGGVREVNEVVER